MEHFKKSFKDALAEALPGQEILLERPRSGETGDLAFPCFRVAKALGQNPQQLARDLAGRALFAQGYQGSRYSYGYPACPDLEGNGQLLDLLQGAAIGVHLSESHQMDPEYTTSALVAWHPQARYFTV